MALAGRWGRCGQGGAQDGMMNGGPDGPAGWGQKGSGIEVGVVGGGEGVREGVGRAAPTWHGHVALGGRGSSP